MHNCHIKCQLLSLLLSLYVIIIDTTVYRWKTRGNPEVIVIKKIYKKKCPNNSLTHLSQVPVGRQVEQQVGYDAEHPDTQVGRCQVAQEEVGGRPHLLVAQHHVNHQHVS